jgi:hypothetical protein
VPDRALIVALHQYKKAWAHCSGFFSPDAGCGQKNPLHAIAMCNDLQGRCRKEQVLPLLLVRHAKELL